MAICLCEGWQSCISPTAIKRSPEQKNDLAVLKMWKTKGPVFGPLFCTLFVPHSLSKTQHGDQFWDRKTDPFWGPNMCPKSLFFLTNTSHPNRNNLTARFLVKFP
mgnify:CR=1 FL=1